MFFLVNIFTKIQINGFFELNPRNNDKKRKILKISRRSENLLFACALYTSVCVPSEFIILSSVFPLFPYCFCFSSLNYLVILAPQSGRVGRGVIPNIHTLELERT
jgi:hypothetical protein